MRISLVLVLSLFPVLSSCGQTPSSIVATTPNVSTKIKQSYAYYGDIFRVNLTGQLYPNGSIDVYTPTGNASIGGNDTGLDGPTSIAVGQSGKIWVGNFNGNVDAFSPGSSGNVDPIAVIQGDNTGLFTGPTFSVTHGPDGNVWVGNEANFLSAGVGYIAVFKPNANGNVSPLRWFESPSHNLIIPTGIAFDLSGNVYITNGDSYKASLFEFAQNSSGQDVTPLAVLKSPANPSGFNDWFPWGVAVDNHGSRCRTLTGGGWYTGTGGSPSGNWGAGYHGRIMIFNECPPSGTKDPDDFIKASVFVNPRGVAVDGGGNIWVADSGANAIFEFSANAHGDSTPIKTISGGSAWGVVWGPTY